MPYFSEESIENLETCDDRIQEILNEAIRYTDFSVTEGYRNEEDQNRYYREGKSQLKYPESKHNKIPSKAVHVLPYPFPGWENVAAFAYVAGYIIAVADQMGYRLRWGGNWDMDRRILTDQEFDDLAHFEILEGNE